MKRISYILFGAVLSVVLGSCVTDPEIQYPNTPQGNLEAMWRIIDEKYCFVEEKGIDWDAIYEEYKTYVDTLKLKDYRGLFNTLAGMLDSLHDGHVNLYSSFDVSRCESWYAGYPTNYNGALLSKYMGNYMIAGGLYYNLLQGVNDSIGYIRYTSFSNGFSSANMSYVLPYFADCKGIIVDVRNNGGGDLTNCYKLASTFMDSTTLVGYWHHKTGKGHQDFSALEPIYVEKKAMPVKWVGPVVVLTNRQCYSATNSFVNCMKNAPHCTIIGGKTGGGGGMPLSYELPNGWMIRFSSVKMYDVEKQSIEEGIDPDVEVTLTSTDKDDLIEAAVDRILRQ